ncbi:hypothetical protein VTK56DRAFT_5688 [Thermocarpiscus australiensis]
MSSDQQLSIDQADLEKLNDRDKAELRQFFASQEQRNRIHSQTHTLAGICWNKCVTGGGALRSGALDGAEKTCLANCVDRFMDANLATVKHLQRMRAQE